MSMNNYINKTTECENKKTDYKFEIQVAKHFENDGYRVYLNCILDVKKDNAIDLICWKDKNLILIQCNNSIPNNENKISHIDLQVFIDSCEDCMEEKNLKYSTLQRMIISSSDILDFSAKKYLEDNDSVKHLVMALQE